MKRLTGSIEHLRLEYKFIGGKNPQSYNGYRFQLDGYPCMLWVNTLSQGPAMRDGEQIDIVVSDGDLVDKSGSNAVYALRIHGDNDVFVCHRHMHLFRGRSRITMSYANFKDMRNAIRTGLALATLVFVGLSLWQAGTAQLSLMLPLFAALAFVFEGGLGLYQFRWQSSWPTRSQQLTIELYAMLNAGSPLHPAPGVHTI